MLVGKPSRRLWIAALVVSVVCLTGLVYALVTDWDTPADPRPAAMQQQQHVSDRGGGGFSLGLVIGIGAGIVIGSLIALRGRRE